MTAYVKRAWPSLWEEKADWETGDKAAFDLGAGWGLEEEPSGLEPDSVSLCLRAEEAERKTGDVTSFNLGAERGREECLPGPKSLGVEGEGVKQDTASFASFGLWVGLGTGRGLEGPCVLDPDSVSLHMTWLYEPIKLPLHGYGPEHYTLCGLCGLHGNSISN